MNDTESEIPSSDLPPFLRRYQDGQSLKPRNIHVVINPAAGTEQNVLSALNQVFKANNIDWETFITKDSGDARRYARASAQAGADVVMACGGDGTVMEVASGLRDTGVPLAILPCGTANVMALELGIVRELTEAISFVVEGRNRLRSVDMALTEEHEFLLRVGIGTDAKMINETPREAKNRWGNLAYVINGLSQFRNPLTARYRLTLDDEVYEEEGITLYVANSANMGLPGVELVPGVDVSDGMLDVILIRPSNLPGLLSVATNALLHLGEEPEPILHWQAREVLIEADPPQPVQVDGEEVPETPFRASVLPKAVRVVCPLPMETPATDTNETSDAA